MYSKNEHECGAEWVIMQMLYWDDYERIDGRWYFRRRLPCYWYASDLNKPPIGDMKMRWPGASPITAPSTTCFRAGREFWADRPDKEQLPEVAAPAPGALPRDHAPRHAGAEDPGALMRLMQSLRLGDLELGNRVVMAPMTRNRAHADGVASDEMVAYYAQRASAGLIVAEGTWPSVTGQAYCRQPGIATPEQVAAWRRVTDAVHANGGLIVLQLMHAGRIGSRHVKPPGIETVAPSAIRAAGEVFTDAAGLQPFDEPRALSTAEVQAVVRERRGRRQRARRRFRRRRAARHQRLPSHAVPVFRHQPSQRRLWRLDAQARALHGRDAWLRWPMPSAAHGWGCDSTPATPTTTRRTTTPRHRTPS